LEKLAAAGQRTIAFDIKAIVMQALSPSCAIGRRPTIRFTPQNMRLATKTGNVIDQEQ
jgi:hypothetical protein